MKKWLVAGAGALVVIVALVMAFAVRLVHSLDTPQLKRSLLDQVSAAAGTKVDARQVDVALLSGITLGGVSVSNPPPYAGNLLTADAFVLRYRLWPLLAGQLELSRLSLRKPALNLFMDSRGGFNYEKLGRSSGSSAASHAALPVELVLSRLSVDGGRVVVRDAASAFVRIEGADLDSSFVVSGQAVEGKGRVRLGTVGLADSLFVRSLSAPLVMAKNRMTLAPIRARIAEGDLNGDVRLDLSGGFRFVAKVDLGKAELRRLLEEAKASQSATGRLSAHAAIEGATGVGSLKGGGRLQVDDCRVTHAAILGLLASVLRVPELDHPDFQECRAEFTLSSGRALVPVLSLKSASIELTGHGVTRLDTLAIDYDLTLALGRRLLDRIPVRELRAAFRDRGDGFGVLDFKVTGTAASPRTDLTARLGKAAAGEAAESGLRKLFGHKRIF